MHERRVRPSYDTRGPSEALRPDREGRDRDDDDGRVGRLAAYPSDGDLWFFTEGDGSVAQNIASSPQVALGFSDPKSNRYVAIAGTGSVVRDKAKIDEKWNKDVEAWFPKGKDDPSIALIRIEPDRGELWDYPAGFISSVAAFVKSKVGGKPDEIGDNEKMML